MYILSTYSQKVEKSCKSQKRADPNRHIFMICKTMAQTPQCRTHQAVRQIPDMH